MKYFAGTQAEIEALGTAAEGMECYATDLDAFGYYDGTSWHWYSAVDSVTRTVGSGKDHSTIQDAVDWFKKKLITGACKIDVDAGSYDEAIVVEDLFIGSQGALEIEGDTRVLAGISYVDGADCNQAGLTNGGDGVVTLSNAGNNVTVAMAATNPDFDADGWGSGDKVLIYNNAGTTTEYTIDSVANNVITLTVAAPAIGNDGTAICLLPDRRIERTSAGPCITIDRCRGVTVDGFYLETSTGANCNGATAQNGAVVIFENIAVLPEDFGFQATGSFSSITMTYGAESVWGGARGFYTSQFAQIVCTYSVSVESDYGFYSGYFGHIWAYYGIAVNCGTAGYYATVFCDLYAYLATARQCTVGYYALYRAYIFAVSTSAQNNGNGTDYNPAVSDAWGNSNASITWS